jgi:hypothetical protein
MRVQDRKKFRGGIVLVRRTAKNYTIFERADIYYV